MKLSSTKLGVSLPPLLFFCPALPHRFHPKHVTAVLFLFHSAATSLAVWTSKIEHIDFHLMSPLMQPCFDSQKMKKINSCKCSAECDQWTLWMYKIKHWGHCDPTAFSAWIVLILKKKSLKSSDVLYLHLLFSDLYRFNKKNKALPVVSSFRVLLRPRRYMISIFLSMSDHKVTLHKGPTHTCQETQTNSTQ